MIAEWPRSCPGTEFAADSYRAFGIRLLRILGTDSACTRGDKARRLAEQMGTAPPWLAPIDRNLEASATIEEIALNSGPATLLQQPGKNGAATRITVVWSVPIVCTC